MKRVVITGFGILSSIGNNEQEIVNSLSNGLSGITFSKQLKKAGIKSHVWGCIKNEKFSISKKKKNDEFSFYI